jgi:hypothetical protein
LSIANDSDFAAQKLIPDEGMALETPLDKDFSIIASDCPLIQA